MATGRAASSRRRGLLFVVSGSVLFAINGTVSKAVLVAGVPALRLTELRVTGTFVLLTLAILVIRPRSLLVTRRELPMLVAYGVVGIALVQTFYFVAIRRLPVGVALLFEYTAPILVALWAHFGQHRRLPSRFWWALAAAMVGLAMVAQVWRGATLSLIGVVAGFGAAASLALYFVLGERTMRGGTRDPYSFTAWGFGVATVVVAVLQPWWSYPWSLLTRRSTVIDVLPAVPVWALVAWVVVLGTLVPYLLTLASLGHLSATASSVASMLEPVLAGAIAWIVLGEALAPVQVVGAGVVLAAIVVAELTGGHPMPTEAAVPTDAGPPSS
jgi:drug/metabolite transporter (DMT)-like permease